MGEQVLQLIKLNGIGIYEMLRKGLEVLEENRSVVDVLNVFPVPDGDTGTNMVLTMKSALKEMQKLESPKLADMIQAAALGSLMGARGNSGVILSQLFRGLAKGLQEKEEASALEFAQAMQLGVKTAYKAVMKPVEGTILTVAREAVEEALAMAEKTDSFSDVLDALLLRGEEALVHTPDLLPVLKRAGVVDAGGKGYMFIWTGAREAVRGLEEGMVSLPSAGFESKDVSDKVSAQIDLSFGADMVLEFQYCTEAIVKGKFLSLETIRQELTLLGDSLMVVGTEHVAKVHVHTNHPGLVLEACLKHGTLHQLKIDNMLEQHQVLSEPAQVLEMLPNKKGVIEEVDQGINMSVTGLDVIDQTRSLWVEPINKKIGVVTVAAGAGIVEILHSLGVDQVVEGGQTMNPSIEELVQAANLIGAPSVLILPNNSNIILAAEQAALFLEKEVRVVPTRNLAQTIGALVAFDPEVSLEDNFQGMLDGSRRVKSGEVTYAVRDSHMAGLEIKANQVLGIFEGDIRTVGAEVSAVVIELLKIMVEEDAELISLFYGEEVETSEAEKLVAVLKELFINCEVELHRGDQPIYYYFISVE
jgi:hypothetical protein